MTSAARTPAGLGSRGRAFWRAATKAYDLEVDELELLREVCRSLDELDTMRAVLTEQGMTVAGSKGQIRAHPMLADVRATRQLVGRLLAQIGLPDDVGQPNVITSLSARGKRGATARWGNREGSNGAA